ncbi:MAG: hypothetical protein Q9214_002448, partial [Letrouitia sp. 1 TL-2023]
IRSVALGFPSEKREENQVFGINNGSLTVGRMQLNRRQCEAKEKAKDLPAHLCKKCDGPNGKSLEPTPLVTFRHRPTIRRFTEIVCC